MQNGIKKYRQETVLDSKVWFAFYFMEAVVFSYLAYKALSIKGQPYLNFVKYSFYFFEVMLVALVFINLLSWTIPINEDVISQFRGCVLASTFERTNFCVFLILMYKLMYSLKRVEF